MTKALSDPKAELIRLRGLLAMREGRAGYSENVKAIKAKIAELEALPK